MFRTIRVLMMMLASLLLGCIYRPDYSAVPRPGDYPLCFSERKRGEFIWDKLDRVQPLPIKEVLLLPQYVKRENGRHKVSVAHPVFYQPGSPLVFYTHVDQNETLDCVLVVCPGYLAEDVPYGFMYYISAYGTKCGIVQLVPSRDVRETLSILMAFRYVLSQPSFQVGPERIVEELKSDEWTAYATSQVLRSMTVPYSLHNDFPSDHVNWSYQPGTTIMCEFTDDERQMMMRFLQPNRNDSSATTQVGDQSAAKAN